ncbi:MAG: hypothetical protein AB1646_07505 [Thermodesulfobacteriota bacterium]
MPGSTEALYRTHDNHRWFFPFLLSGVLFVAYAAWMTGFTFTFSEVELAPNYQMLANAFAKGRLDIEETPQDDASTFRGKRYLYFGPVPACLRLPAAFFGGSIPTGFMVVLFSAGLGAAYWEILRLLSPRLAGLHGQSHERVFGITFVLSGYSLFLATLPYIHHEAIAAASFFLMVAVGVFLRALLDDFRISIRDAAVCGAAVALSFGSRFSYVFSGIFLVGSLLVGMRGKARSPWPAIVLVGIPLFGLALLLAYNYARFGAVGEFGMTHADSIVYEDYLRQGRFWRYDNLPYNVWDYFFRMPSFEAKFPFVKTSLYILKVESVSNVRYFLIHVNELVGSVFFMMPILLGMFIALRVWLTGEGDVRARCVRSLAVLFFLQVLPLCLSMASTARYCCDFLPVMMIVSFVGATAAGTKCWGVRVTAFAGMLSLLLSWTIAINGIVEYAEFLGYRSPLLRFLSH